MLANALSQVKMLPLLNCNCFLLVATVFVAAATPASATTGGQGFVISCGVSSRTCPEGCYHARPSVSEDCMEVGLGYASPKDFNERHMCTPGTFSNVTKAGTCRACEPGSISKAFASAECFSCPDGQYQPFPGKWWCIPCKEATPDLKNMYCDAVNGVVTDVQNSTAIPSSSARPTGAAALFVPSAAPTKSGTSLAKWWSNTTTSSSHTSSASGNLTESTTQSDRSAEPVMYALISVSADRSDCVVLSVRFPDAELV